MKVESNKGIKAIRHEGNKKVFSYCLIVLSPYFAICNSAFAFDINELGDFSSRSVIEGSLFNTTPSIPQEIKDILKEKKLYPDTKCLIEQIKKGNIENVELLLKAKVNPNQDYMTDYPVYIAARENKFEILKLLCNNNAKIDRGFFSELYEALKNKNHEMAQYLLDRGANVRYIDAVTNDTILYTALKNKMYDIAGQMILKGAPADQKSIIYIKKHKLEYLIPQQ